MANGRYNHNPASAGTQAAGLVSYAPGDTNATEEFTGETTALNLKTITDSWFMILISYKRKED